MNAREKLGNLTLLWVAYSVVTSGVMFFINGGFGFWNIMSSSVGLLIGVGLSVVIGQALLKRNGFVRWAVALLAGAGTLLGMIAMGKLCLLFVATWSFNLFVPLLIVSAMVAMNGHSLKVLFDRDVRRYFA